MSMFFKTRSSKPPAMTLEGILGPNSRLEDARSLPFESPEALAVAADGSLLVAAGASVWSLGGWNETPLLRLSAGCRITALAAGPAGRVAVGTETGEVHVREAWGQTPLWTVAAAPVAGPAVDCLFLAEDEIVVTRSGYADLEEALARSPWDSEGRGMVRAHSRDGASRAIAESLPCPMGLCVTESGGMVITEMDAARAVTPDGQVLRAGFPGYLGRIRKTPKGYLLSCVSRRDPLIEFLRTEREFVDEMKRTIDPRHWISPRVNPEFSHDFPIELGATRLFGQVKPWAPSFSYGLLIMLDNDLMPTGSAQSRANGGRHAISDALLWNGEVIAVSRASGEILNLGSWT